MVDDKLTSPDGCFVRMASQKEDQMLKEIHIDQLRPGMYVNGIGKQRGQLKIKSQGRVTKEASIIRLKQQGILSVYVDTSRLEQDKPEASPLDDPIADALAIPDPDPIPESKKNQGPTSFDEEIGVAQQLNAQGTRLQKVLANAIAKGLPVDADIPRAFTEKMVSSLDRNPNALLCLAKIREKDSYLFEHSLNVSVLLANFARHLGLPRGQVNELAFAGFLHDIGKIQVPDEVLHKPGKLTEEEFDVMRNHVDLGTEFLRGIDGIPPHILRTVAEHHERLDGNGYPMGKKGNEISKWGRMIAIVDSYDAITAQRCYKNGCASDRAFKILMKESPAKFDKELLAAFISCMGIYPIGTLVLLDNEKVAMVTGQNRKNLARPQVKVFYNAKGQHYCPQKDLDLNFHENFKIVRAVVPEEFGIDFNRFFNASIAVA